MFAKRMNQREKESFIQTPVRLDYLWKQKFEELRKNFGAF